MTAPSKDRVVEVLRRFNVRLHYQATSDNRTAKGVRGAPKYAVFADGDFLTEPTTHKEAQEQRLNVVAQELIDLFCPEEGGAA